MPKTAARSWRCFANVYNVLLKYAVQMSQQQLLARQRKLCNALFKSVCIKGCKIAAGQRLITYMPGLSRNPALKLAVWLKKTKLRGMDTQPLMQTVKRAVGGIFVRVKLRLIIRGYGGGIIHIQLGAPMVTAGAG